MSQGRALYPQPPESHIPFMDELEFEKTRYALAEAAYRHAPFDGWTPQALEHAAHDLGLSGQDVQRFLPRGPIEAIELVNRLADAAMVEAMQKHDLQNMRVRDRIILGVRTRLEQNEAGKEAIRRAMTFLALPQNAPSAARMLYRTVDAIWRAAGDTSTDYNFYTKRGLLAGVYSSTLLYWLNDRSEGHAASWAFLDRRIDEAMKIPGTVAKMRDRLKGIPTPFGLARAFSRHRPRPPYGR